MGNTKANTLPVCLLTWLRDRANVGFSSSSSSSSSLPGRSSNSNGEPTWFWIDTICVPRERRLRNIAIQGLVRVYKDAEVVIVMDQSILGLSKANSSPFARMLYSRICPWTTRVWTFQEAWLAKKLCYAFHDEIQSDEDMIREWIEFESAPMKPNIGQFMDNFDLSPDHEMDRTEKGHAFLTLRLAKALSKVANGDEDGDVLWDVADGEAIADCIRKLEMATDRYLTVSLPTDDERLFSWVLRFWRFDRVFNDAMYSSTHIGAAKRKPDYLRRFGSILRGLDGRTTSRIEDESICVGSTMGLDVGLILRATIDRRMEVLLRLLREVPRNLVFSFAPRLSTPGLRWAPKTFLRDVPDVSIGPNVLGKVDEFGLKATFPGINLHLKDKPMPSQKISISIEDLIFTLDLGMLRATDFPLWRDFQALDLRVLLPMDPRDYLKQHTPKLDIPDRPVELSHDPIYMLGALGAVENVESDQWTVRFIKSVWLSMVLEESPVLDGTGAWINETQTWCVT